MTRFFPILAGVLLIVGLTTVQIRMTDRLSGTNFSVEQRAELLSLVPKTIGDWHGEDKPVDPNVQKTAGAIGAVSRDYRNSRTGERVELWLIVGHARDVSAHTPDICYPSSGFTSRAKENGLYPLVMTGRQETPFWTNTFYKEDELTGRSLRRVFWSWFNPESAENDGKVVWEAPQNARYHFGNVRALYKIYFTSEMRDPSETAEKSAALHFARDFLPEVDKALAEVAHKLNEGGSSQPAVKKPAETPAATSSAEQPKAAPDAKVILPGEVYHTFGAGESAPAPAATPGDSAKPAAPAPAKP